MARVLLGMSGGVDSSVAAYLLKNDGYEVVGVTMTLFNQTEEESIRQIGDAKRVCEKLGIEHHVVDYKKEFKDIIIKDFIDNYLSGKTPNPCIKCNKHFKPKWWRCMFSLHFNDNRVLRCPHCNNVGMCSLSYNQD